MIAANSHPKREREPRTSTSPKGEEILPREREHSHARERTEPLEEVGGSQRCASLDLVGKLCGATFMPLSVSMGMSSFSVALTS